MPDQEAQQPPNQPITPISLSCVPTFDPHGDQCAVAERWDRWLRGFETYAKASGVQNDGQKRELVLHCAGAEVQDRFRSIPETGESYQEAKDALNESFSGFGGKGYSLI